MVKQFQCLPSHILWCQPAWWSSDASFHVGSFTYPVTPYRKHRLALVTNFVEEAPLALLQSWWSPFLFQIRTTNTLFQSGEMIPKCHTAINTVCNPRIKASLPALNNSALMLQMPTAFPPLNLARRFDFIKRGCSFVNRWSFKIHCI